MEGNDEWSREGMEDRRPPCFHFFLDECEHGETCNYNHNPVFKANLGNIPQNASKVCMAVVCSTQILFWLRDNSSGMTGIIA